VIAAATAATASNLFRMAPLHFSRCVFTLQGAGLRQRAWEANSSATVMFRKNHCHIRGIFGQIS
jgi:hypothetical protein